MIAEERGNLYSASYSSVSELAAGANGDKLPDFDPKFAGVKSIGQAVHFARDGWTTELDHTLEVAESAVSKVERDVELPTFTAEYDVAGCEVDVARFLDGTPENMIDYPLVPIVRAGRVITLCASISISGAVSAENIIKRGQTVAALAMVLSRLGYSCEIWADLTASGDGHRVQIRTLVKGANDALDAERVVYALAHPSMLRVLGFAALRSAPDRWVSAIGYSSLGSPTNPIEDLPDGTIYLPCMLRNHDVPDADKEITRYLRQLEIIPEED